MKTRLFAAFAAVLFSAAAVHATVKPKLSYLVQRSQLIVTAKVIAVGPWKGRTRKIVIEPEKFLKSPLNIPPRAIAFRYQRVGKGFTDFAAMKKDGGTRVFMLRFVPEKREEVDVFHLRLVDAWFGVEKASRGIVRKIRKAVK